MTGGSTAEYREVRVGEFFRSWGRVFVRMDEDGGADDVETDERVWFPPDEGVTVFGGAR